MDLIRERGRPSDGADGAFSPRPVFIALDTRGEHPDDDNRPGTEPGTATTRLPSRTLVELIGQANLQAIQDAFAIAFDIPTVVLDHDGYNVSEITHRVAFCEDLTRPSRAGGRCLSCDRSGMATSAVTHRPTIFHCWNRLWDCTVPIVSARGELFGYFLSGQVFFERQSDLRRYDAVAAEHGIDAERYVAAAEAVRVMPRDVYVRGIECIAVLARMIADQASAALQHRELLDTLLSADAQTRRLAGELDTIAIAASQLGAASGEGLSSVAQLCDAIERVIACDSVVIFRLDQDLMLRPVVVRDPYPDAISRLVVRHGRGIVGTVAATGEAMQVDEVASHPLFEPIPGVPVEAEALVALPLEHAGEVVGVLQVSRLRRRTFTRHEHDLLRILALNVAVALGTSSLRTEAVRYRQAAAAHRALIERVAAGVSFSELCEDLLAHADSLLSITRAAVRLNLGAGESLTATLHMNERTLRTAERTHAEAIQRVRDRGRAVSVADGPATLLICGIGGAEGPTGSLLIHRETPFTELERDVAESLAQHGAIALRALWQQRQARALNARASRLAELSRSVARAPSQAEVALALLHAHELIGTGTSTVVALQGPAPGVLDLWQRRDAEVGYEQLVVAGRPALRFPAATTSDDGAELFDAWGRAVAAEARPGASGEMVATVALLGHEHRWGGLLIAAGRAPDRAERAVLQVLGQAAAAALDGLESAPAAKKVGDNSREVRLAGLHDVALRLLESDQPEQVGRRICAELRDLVGADRVMLQLRREPDAESVPVASTPLTRDARRNLLERGSRWAELGAPASDDGLLGIPFDLADGSRALLLAEGCREDADPIVLGVFTGYCVLALGNSHTAAVSRREAVARERAVRGAEAREARLRAVIDADAELIAASLAPDGLSRVASTLSRTHGASVAIYDAEGRRLAATADQPPVISADAPGDAIPVANGDEHLGWLVVSATEATPDAEAVRFGAASVAVALLRARASSEAEARRRGEYVEALLVAERPTDTLVRHGRAVGHDPQLPARVAVARSDSLNGAELYDLVFRGAQDRPGVLLAQRADELVLLGPDEGAWPDDLRDLLSAPSVRIGVGGSTATHDYRQSYLGASRAVAALRHLGRFGLISIDGEGLEQLLLRAAEPELLAAFVRRVLGPLDSYDQERSSELRRTVELCVENGWNLQASARAAHVHHSTLRYRLQRVGALTGLELKHPDDRLAVQLALMADRVLRG